VQPFGHIMSGRFMSGAEGALACAEFQLCKEVLARLLQALFIQLCKD